MFANERQKKIAEMLKDKGAVLTAELVKLFGVSIETVRRDLLAMEAAGMLTRVHGGAVENGGMTPRLTLSERTKEHESQKKALADTAAAYISEGDVVGIDQGSTAIALAFAIKRRFTRLTVITHSLDVFNILAGHREIQVILIGGYYMAEENALYGKPALSMLSQMRVGKAFIFPSGISVTDGIFDFQNELCQMQSALIGSADEVYILADSTKLERRALLKISDMNTAYKYITDSSVSEEIKKLYLENNIKLITEYEGAKK